MQNSAFFSSKRRKTEMVAAVIADLPGARTLPNPTEIKIGMRQYSSNDRDLPVELQILFGELFD